MTTVLRPKRRCEKCGLNRLASRYSSEKARVCDVCKREQRRAAHRKRHLMETYEITTEEYDEILAAQHFVCAVCEGDRPYNLHVDHDHLVEETIGVRASVRGLLCKRCNGALASVRDDPDLLLRLAGYLVDPPAQKVLRHAA